MWIKGGNNMIIKMTNKEEKFYQYMGKFFGSRLIEKQTNDRIYDDDSKEWYLYLKEERVMAFVSVSKNTIKNIYATREEYLEEILKEIKKKNSITYSIVTNNYAEVYKKCGFKMNKNQEYKNFVTIYMEEEEATA